MISSRYHGSSVILCEPTPEIFAAMNGTQSKVTLRLRALLWLALTDAGVQGVLKSIRYTAEQQAGFAASSGLYTAIYAYMPD